MNRDEMLPPPRGGGRVGRPRSGGGATGLGVAVDAQTRGYRTLLLEQADFAKGTSSRRTKLVHGGVRYLEQGNVAPRPGGPARARPPAATRPTWSATSPSSCRATSGGRARSTASASSSTTCLAGKLKIARSRHPRPRGDDRAHPQRRDARPDRRRHVPRRAVRRRAHGGDAGADRRRPRRRLLNYMRRHRAAQGRGRDRGVAADDRETGTRVRVRGPRRDQRHRRLRRRGAPARRRRRASRWSSPSQGVHLVLDRASSRATTAIMVPHTDDGRVLFVIPWHERVLVGTTDTRDAAPEIEPRAAARGDRVHPAQRRPLSRPGSVEARRPQRLRRPAAAGAATPGKTATKEISREHEVLISSAGLVTIVGGKWTTYRKMAQDTVDDAIAVGGLPRAAVRHRDAAPARLDEPRRPETPADPMRVYGTDVATSRRSSRERARPRRAAAPAPPLPAGAGRLGGAPRDGAHARGRPRAPHPQPAARRGASIEAAPRAAALLARELGRDAAWADAQVEAYRRLAAGYRIAPA